MYTAKYEIYATTNVYCGEVSADVSADKARYKAMAEVAKTSLKLKQKKIISQYAIVKVYRGSTLVSEHRRNALGVMWKEVQHA